MSAEEMFDELGYIKNEKESYIQYDKVINENDYEIMEIIFWKNGKSIDIDHYYNDDGTFKSMPSNIETIELQAIKKQIEELGWF